MLRFDLLLEARLLVQQALHLLVAEDVRVEDLGDILGLHLDVEDVVGEDLDDGTFVAEAEAARRWRPCTTSAQSLPGDQCLEVRRQSARSPRRGSLCRRRQGLDAVAASGAAEVDPAVEQRLEALCSPRSS